MEKTKSPSPPPPPKKRASLVPPKHAARNKVRLAQHCTALLKQCKGTSVVARNDDEDYDVTDADDEDDATKSSKIREPNGGDMDGGLSIVETTLTTAKAKAVD